MFIVTYLTKLLYCCLTVLNLLVDCLTNGQNRSVMVGQCPVAISNWTTCLIQWMWNRGQFVSFTDISVYLGLASTRLVSSLSCIVSSHPMTGPLWRSNHSTKPTMLVESHRNVSTKVLDISQLCCVVRASRLWDSSSSPISLRHRSTRLVHNSFTETSWETDGFTTVVAWSYWARGTGIDLYTWVV